MTDVTQNSGAAAPVPPAPPRPMSAADLAAQAAARKAAGVTSTTSTASAQRAPAPAAAPASSTTSVRPGASTTATATSPAPPAAPQVPPPPAPSARSQGAPPPPRPEDHPWDKILHPGRCFHITSTNWPLLYPYLLVPLQVMQICNDRNSISGAQRGMLVAVEASFARAQGLEPVLFLLLPDQDPNITISLDPAYHDLERYSFLNTVAQPNRILAPHWNGYYALGQLCPTFVPPARPAYSYVTPARTCVTAMDISYATAISGMFFGLGYALAFDDPWFDYYYTYPGLYFYEGYGYYDPMFYTVGVGGLVLAEAAVLGAACAGLGIGIGLGLVAALEIAIFADLWCDPFLMYEGPGLMIVEPGCFVYGGGGFMFDGGYGGYVGMDGSSFAVADYSGGYVPLDGYVDAPYVDNGYLPDPGATYGDFGGTGYNAATGNIDTTGGYAPGGQQYVPDAGPGGTGYDPNAGTGYDSNPGNGGGQQWQPDASQQYVPDAGAGGTGDQTVYEQPDQSDYVEDAGPGGGDDTGGC